MAKEGAKKNVFANVLIQLGTYCTLSFSSIIPSNRVLPDDPTSNAPVDLAESASLIAYLVHDKNTKINGNCYQIGNGQVAKLRWQRSSGLLLRADDSLTPAVLLNQWQKATNFEKHDYASGPRDFLELVKEGQKLPRNADVSPISFKGRAVLVTGAGSG